MDDGTHSRDCDEGTLKWDSLRLLLLRIGEPFTDLCFVNIISPTLSLPSPLQNAYELLYLVHLWNHDVPVLPASPA